MNNLFGLANLGNTCYLNATLQVIFSIHELNHYLLTINNLQNLHNIDDSHLTREWISLYKFISNNNNSIISPNRFVEYSRVISKRKNRDEFSGMEQNDANDYFYFLIESFHNSLNKLDSIIHFEKSKYNFINEYIENIEKTDYSVIPILFNSCLIYNYINLQNNNKEFHKIEHGYTIELSIPKQSNRENKEITIYDCFDETFKDDILEKENAWFDDKTNTKKDVIKQTKICYLPQILVIHLKRWVNYTHKNTNLIQCPSILDLTPYLFDNDIYKSYELTGIINHTGNIFGGHYFSYVKKQNEWFCCDDTNTRKMSEKEIINSSNYCLFFRRK
jgi:ubiquitin carboxyl-terminal hydrolase 8